jgi:putative tributyrin esterase
MVRIHLQLPLNMINEDVVVLAPSYGFREAATGTSEEAFYGKKFKCLWLLHGMGGTASDWISCSQIELFAEEKSIFVVCPYAGDGFYTDCPQGDLWETRLMGDVWDYLHTLFPLMSEAREDNFVAGLSMGGYGAMRYALTHPDKFCFGASLSGGLNVPQRFAEGENINGHMERSFGPPDKVVSSNYDLYVAAKNLKESGIPLPKLYISCGTKDWEYKPNMAFRDYLKEMGYAVTWDQGDYGHEWRFWNEQIEKVLNIVIPENFISAAFNKDDADKSVRKRL